MLRTSTVALSCLRRSCGGRRSAALVDDEQAQVAEGDVLAEQPVGADEDVELALGGVRQDVLALLGCAKAADVSTTTGVLRKRSVKVRMCWSARMVVGTRTATCFPERTARKAARRATSVLPKPTSPQRRRSMGWGEIMSSTTRRWRSPGAGFLVGEGGLELAEVVAGWFEGDASRVLRSA